jgi:hypothetical protein
MQYDRNGLQLSSIAKSRNAYLHTAVDINRKKYAAYAQASRPLGAQQWAMFPIGFFDDPRDAAFVAQSFQDKYNRDNIRQMVEDGEFNQVASDFVKNLDIPEWKYPAEGILIEDILCDYGYKNNIVPDAKVALREVITVFELKTPPLKDVKGLIDQVEKLYKSGMTYRESARIVMNIKEKELS